MKRNQIKQTVLAAAVVALGFVSVFFLSRFLQANMPAAPAGVENEEIIAQTAKLKGFAFGLESLIADWYWMNSLQYIGDKIVNHKENVNLEDLTALNPRLLYPYLDAATTLDPRFTEVYSYGAIVLPAIDREQAIKLTEKGIAANPDEWRLYQQLGYIYWRLENYEKAAEVYAAGAKIASAPPFMRAMAARMKNQGGDRETARAIYEQMYSEADDEQTREAASIRLLELDSLAERDAINKILEIFKAKNNRCPNNWREVLLSLKDIRFFGNKPLRLDMSFSPVDPTGAAYLLAAENDSCRAALDPEKTKLPPR